MRTRRIEQARLLDFGSHLADHALVLAGPVSGVYAEMHYLSGPGGLDAARTSARTGQVVRPARTT